MKKTIVAAFAAIVFAQLALAAPVPPTPVDPPQVNPLNIARAFALKTPAYYEGWMTGYAAINNAMVFESIQFRMEKDFSITSLIINETAIPLPKPIYGIPLGDGGWMKEVYLNINAMTETGEYAGSGYIQKAIVLKGESLAVALTPAEVRQEITVDVARYQNDISLTIENFPYSYGYGYGEDGKFYAYLPPVGGNFHYILRRYSDGTVIGEGWVEPFKPATAPKETFVGVKYLGNVIGASFTQPDGTDDWTGVTNLAWDCDIPTQDGKTVKGKVLFVDCQSGGLEVTMFSGECWVYVQRATSESGDMPFLPLEDHSYAGQFGTRTFVHTKDIFVGKVVITIIPKGESGWLNASASLHRFYTPQPNAGGNS